MSALRSRNVALYVSTALVVAGAVWLIQRGPSLGRVASLEDAKIAVSDSSEHVQEPRASEPQANNQMEAVTPAAVGNTPPAQSNWKSAFEQTDDYGSFVVAAAQAADAGDADAAWYLAEAIATCGGVVKFGRQGGTEHDYLTAMMPKHPYPRQSEEMSQRFQRCIGMASDKGVLTEWRQEHGGKMTMQYWRDRALELGSAPAKAEFIVTNLARGDALSSSQEGTVLVDKIRGYAQDIVRSKDPDALFNLGMRLSMGDAAKDPTYGLALALAACDLGYDCSAENKRNVWSACKKSGRCAADQTIADVFRSTFGERRYSQAYARAQEFKDLVAREDWAEVDRFVRVDGPLLQ